VMLTMTLLQQHRVHSYKRQFMQPKLPGSPTAKLTPTSSD